MLMPGGLIDLVVEKPAAGGRMIARYEGQIVLVLGAIPGERVTARIERVEKRLAFASVATVLEASPDRREPTGEPGCGGCLYAHIDYARQVSLKSGIIADAFIRIGRIPLPSPVAVAPSPERGYRMRARLHVAGGRAGFLREGTHQLCEAGPTGQLHPASMDAIEAALAALGPAAAGVASVEISENVAATERAFHLELGAGETISETLLASAVAAASLTGCSARSAGGAFAMAGDPTVTDPLPALTNGRAASGELRRHAASFFQANRFLLVDLVGTVMDGVPSDGEVLDLYAGVGLFAVSLAASGRDRLFAVEGDRESGADLLRNAAPFAGRLQAVVGRVEDQIRRRTGAGAVIVDPPRTGMSRDALDAIVRLGARRLIYASCDPPTMARDARRLLDQGYRLVSLKGFDLFPNTPHVETVGIFERLKLDPVQPSAFRLSDPPHARGAHERVEQRPELAGPPEVLRMPLHTEAEALVRRLDRLDDAVGGRRGCDERLAQRGDGLMVPAVDAAGVAVASERALERGALADLHIVREGVLGQLDAVRQIGGDR